MNLNRNFNQELYTIINNRIITNGFELSKDLQRELKDLIRKGLDNLYPFDDLTENKITEAKINSLVLADALLAEGIKKGGIKILDSDTLKKIKNSICPLFPFC
ncbi:hypothetical protein [Aquimarina sp. 2201CG5-10]|uniref:hypothetical protein n=1 Tax=Aquimarina callyspongiae TaxID=3098150 RepID=UPI002AB44411|nr:hypothetical protein [Aquimarina sp. 2201CG5-10]MDY8136537.1 hypothetical protein [Aquimarina sp. 2201CG5-10]